MVSTRAVTVSGIRTACQGAALQTKARSRVSKRQAADAANLGQALGQAGLETDHVEDHQDGLQQQHQEQRRGALD